MVPLLPTLPRYLPHPFCSSSATSQSHYHHRDTPKKTPQKPTKTHLLLLQQINSKRLTIAHYLSHKSSSQTQPTTPNLTPQKIHKRILFPMSLFPQKETAKRNCAFFSWLSGPSPRIEHSSRSSKNLKGNIRFPREDDVGLGLEMLLERI
jgi:hypothetical protein